jgi:putative flavoprotein involved in K+ transport
MSTSRPADWVTGGEGTTMHRIETLVVGAGQAGLAVSRCLAEQGADHAVVERGRIAERWRTARWQSLRLITPNWMSRLPAWSYAGSDPDGYMAAPELVGYLEDYAGSFAAPVHENTTVELVEASGDGLRVVTDRRTWHARNVIVATGTENRAHVPPLAGGIDPGIHQLTAGQYRGPHQVPDGGVLVVGASASGAQIADELRRAGRPVTISVGRHSRLPRRYRGQDILWWMDRAGILGHTIDQMRDARSARSAPSLQLTGRTDHQVGLDALAARGVTLAGRLVAADGRRLSFADDLPATIGAAQERMERMLRTIDGYIAHVAGDEYASPADPPPPPATAAGPASLDLRRAGIRNVIWATGYRPAYPWLRVPALDRHGQIAHHRGVTGVPGLYVLGLKFLYRRDSTYVDGVRHDARFVAAHVTRRMTTRAGPDACGLSA